MSTIKVGDRVRVPNQFTRPGELRVDATVVKIDPPLVWVRFYWQGKWRNSRHNLAEAEQ